MVETKATGWDGIDPDACVDYVERMVPTTRMTTAARQRIAYAMAGMEDLIDGKLRSEGDEPGRQHLL